MIHFPCVALARTLFAFAVLIASMAAGADGQPGAGRPAGEPVAPAAEPVRLLSIDTWFTWGALASYQLIHDANQPRPALVASAGLPGLRATLADGSAQRTGVSLIEGAPLTAAKEVEALRLLRTEVGDPDSLHRFVRKKPDMTVLTVQMLGPVNRREQLQPLLEAIRAYHEICQRQGVQPVILAAPEWYLQMTEHPAFAGPPSPEIAPMVRLAAVIEVPVAPAFLAFDLLRRRHPQIHTHAELNGYEPGKNGGGLGGMNHPRGGDSYVMAAVLYVTLTGEKIVKSPDLASVRQALDRSYRPDPGFTLSAEAQTVVHQVAWESVQEFIQMVAAARAQDSTPDRPSEGR